ncbi:MAG: polyphosphate polymerase domain-containing protein [Lachnospiraceae bacterium]|nr:polyphosphate polymerase domain-containing protein [Lachnospiraceae bacterium]
MSQEIFKRYEKKYLLNETQYETFRERLSHYMKEDRYGNYTIGNIYYDTRQYDLIRNSIDKPLYKEKFRIRSYGVPSGQDKVFLEIKKKFDGIVYKRRSEVPYCELIDVMDGGLPKEKTQIMNEISWFFQIHHPEPKVYIAYDRLALYGMEDPELRVTFDTNIRWRKDKLDLSAGDYGDEILRPNQILMEIKIPGTIPLWMSEALTEAEIYPTSFSKYGTCYQKYLFHDLLPENTYQNNNSNIAYNPGGKKQCLAVS